MQFHLQIGAVLSHTFHENIIPLIQCVDNGLLNLLIQLIRENRQYIKDNVLFHHDTLPLGEFAIGTNTTAYVSFVTTDNSPSSS